MKMPTTWTATATSRTIHPTADHAAPRDVPNRRIYCIDLRVRPQAADFVEEIRRIAQEMSVQTVSLMDWIQGNPNQRQLERYLHPERLLNVVHADGNGNNGAAVAHDDAPLVPEPTKRRWYPVIDYSRCTNCMECIDFCLFGVYGVDKLETILVEQQDNCKQGLPGVQPRLSRKRDHLPAAQDAGHRRRRGRSGRVEDRPVEAVRRPERPRRSPWPNATRNWSPTVAMPSA